MKTDIVLLCGAPNPDYTFLSAYDYSNVSIIAVDSGLEICKKLQLTPELLVGDFDSVSQKTLEMFSAAPRLEFPKRKNASDTELALDEAIRYSPSSITLLNASGARPDHFFCNVQLLLHYPWKASLVDVYGRITALAPNIVYEPTISAGTTFSLFPLSPSSGLTISGAEYPLDNEQAVSATLTLSNISTGSTKISYTSGTLLLFVSNDQFFKN